jgi:hypothetical protein
VHTNPNVSPNPEADVPRALGCSGNSGAGRDLSGERESALGRADPAGKEGDTAHHRRGLGSRGAGRGRLAALPGHRSGWRRCPRGCCAPSPAARASCDARHQTAASHRTLWLLAWPAHVRGGRPPVLNRDCLADSAAGSSCRSIRTGQLRGPAAQARSSRRFPGRTGRFGDGLRQDTLCWRRVVRSAAPHRGRCNDRGRSRCPRRCRCGSPRYGGCSGTALAETSSAMPRVRRIRGWPSRTPRACAGYRRRDLPRLARVWAAGKSPRALHWHSARPL